MGNSINTDFTKIFVIGKIGSGKSTCAKNLNQIYNDNNIKSEYFNLDQIGNDILKQPSVIKSICEKFDISPTGNNLFLSKSDNVNVSEIVSNPQKLSKFKGKISKIAFKSQKNLHDLETILHPEISKKTLELFNNFENNNYRVVVVEQTSFKGKNDKFINLADKVIGVIADKEIRKIRAAQNGFKKNDFNSRNNIQISQKDIASFADCVIFNNGDIDNLNKQLNIIYEKLL